MIDNSQNGESKILHELFDKIGVSKGFYLDIGAGDGVCISNTYYFDQLGWSGVKIDGDNKGNAEVVERWITLDNVQEIVGMCGSHVNLLDIDLDSNDYWILDAILSQIKPDVIMYEVNSQLPLNKSLAMPYNPEYHWDGTTYFGLNTIGTGQLISDLVF